MTTERPDGLPPHGRPAPRLPPGRLARRRRWWPWLLLVLLLLGTLAALYSAYTRVGRTPAEIVDYLRRRMMGHPSVEMLVDPVLSVALRVLDEPDPRQPLPPFVVPPPPGGARLAVAALAASAPVDATPGAEAPIVQGAIWRVGPTRSMKRISLAARLARDGDTIEIDPGDYIADVAAWERDRLTIRGTGPGVRLIADGNHAEGKAIWVVRGGRVLIENITFVGATVPDGNGAGVRLESGQLTVRNCLFHGNESGLLTSNDAQATLTIEDSEFAYNGSGDGLTHGLYVGQIRRLSVRGSWFHHGNVGHLIKSRAVENEIAYNRLADGSGGRSSYELEFPSGGIARVVGNLIEQSADTRNSVMVIYGAEGMSNPVNALYMAHNTLLNNRARGGTFVRVFPGAQQVLLRNNVWIGAGRVQIEGVIDDVQNDDNAFADFDALVDPLTGDWRVRAAERGALSLAGRAPLPDALQPRFEYRAPRGLKALGAPPSVIGAVQSRPD